MHLNERGVTTTVEHSVLGPVRTLSSPLRLSKTPPRIRRGAPVFGEHPAAPMSDLESEVRAGGDIRDTIRQVR